MPFGVIAGLSPRKGLSMRTRVRSSRASATRAGALGVSLFMTCIVASCGDGGITAPGQPVHQFTGVSVSGQHRCVVAIEGDAYCWGGNFYGQIGIGLTSPKVVAPSLVSSNARWVDVASGQISTCGLTDSGLISCWGDNGSGQLGNGTGVADSVPAPAVRGPVFQALSVGFWHACALDADGVAWCWGYGGNRQLGQGPDESNRDLPAKVRGGHRFASVSAGLSHSCGLQQDRTAWCWGGNEHGQLGIGVKGDPRGTPRQVDGDLRFIQLSAGHSRTCGVTADGLAYCWGANPDGALGDGTTEGRDVPTPVHGELRFRRVATAEAHTCGLTEDGSLYCWGRNNAGQLGDGTRQPSAVPSRVATFTRFVIFGVGGSDTCAVSTNGEPYCWGAGAVPRSRGPTELPQRVIIQRGQVADEPEPDTAIVIAEIAFESIVAGTGWACGVDDAGTGYCWTSDGRYPFSGESRAAPLPQAVPGDVRWKHLAAGRDFACGIALDGAAYCWGRNYSGQLGNGSEKDSEVPILVAGGGRYKSISATVWGGHVCAVTEAGDAYCWGSNWGGALGNGSHIGSSPLPVAVIGGVNFESVAAGGGYTCGLTAVGDTYCWGVNEGDIRGPDSIYVRTEPTPVAPGFRFGQLRAATDHICGLSRDGLANYCWGSNDVAQIGTGTRSYSVPTPSPTVTIPTLVTIGAGYRYTCGATAQGTAYCWGFDRGLALGTGERFELNPTRVLGNHRFRTVTAGYDVSCGLTFEGELYCWGAGYGASPRLVARP